MGVHIHGGTMPGGYTPICNRCGVSLCWDISEEDYVDKWEFWDDWICQDCNDGERMNIKEYYKDRFNNG